MKFAYRRYDTPTESPLDGATEVFRPEIPVRLIGSRGDVFVLGLLDTGSDSVVLGRGIAERIGVRLSRQRRWRVHGFGGQALPAVRGLVDVELVHHGDLAGRAAKAVEGDLDPEAAGFGEGGKIRWLGHHAN